MLYFFEVKTLKSLLQIGQLSQSETIGRAVDQKMTGIQQTKTLDLGNFHGHPFFSDLIINMGNIKCFETICSKFNSIDAIRNYAFSVVLSKNNIETLAPMRYLHHFGNLKSLDLRHNNITDMEDLKNLKVFLISSIK